jgi:hypothetical protein
LVSLTAVNVPFATVTVIGEVGFTACAPFAGVVFRTAASAGARVEGLGEALAGEPATPTAAVP